MQRFLKIIKKLLKYFLYMPTLISLIIFTLFNIFIIFLMQDFRFSKKLNIKSNLLYLKKIMLEVFEHNAEQKS